MKQQKEVKKDLEVQDPNEPVYIDKEEFRKDYKEALSKGEEKFYHKRLLFVVDYAKYLLEYLDGQNRPGFHVSTSNVSGE